MIVTTEGLVRNGFAPLPYPKASRDRANELVEKWKAFCALPLEEKLKLTLREDCGYQWKERSQGRDPKENFDIKLGGVSNLLDGVHLAGAPTIARELIECSRAMILDVISPVASQFAERVESLCGIPGLEAEVMRGQLVWQLRLLHYLDGTPGKEIAAQHVDKSGFTLHLHESGPGLQYLDWDKVWRDVRFGDGKTVIFPGLQLQLRSNGALTGLCHRVVGSEACAGDRYSAVCFVLLADTPMYDKDRVGPSQSQAPGYNYGLSHEELRKFFGDVPALSV